MIIEIAKTFFIKILLGIVIIAVVIFGAYEYHRLHNKIDELATVNEMLTGSLSYETESADEFAEKVWEDNAHIDELNGQIEAKQNEIDELRKQVASDKKVSASPQKSTVKVESTGDAKSWIMMKESGGNPNATNGKYCGLFQTPCSHTPLGDVAKQNEIADAYVAGRYGTWEKAKEFWLQKGWY